jgi:glycosyltransferase involved in cell wall biosynthesis
MKIAFVSSILWHPWGGADALWTLAADAALARGDEVLIAVSEVAAPHPRVQALAARGARIVIRPRSDRVPTLRERIVRKARERLHQPDRLVRAMRAFSPATVICSGGGTYDLILEPALCAWLRSSGTPYRVIANFQREHPLDDEPDRARVRDILAAADRIFFVSNRNLEVTRRHLLIPLANAECIHGCMVHNAITAPGPLPWPDGSILSFATVGRLEPVKGVDLLLHSLAAGLGRVDGWRLNIYGRGRQREYLEECARCAGLSGRVRFPGFAPSIEDVWRENHLLVSPAIDEGIPMTIIEAMLCGRAVLATDVGAAAEWIEPGRTGFLCPAPTKALLEETLREAWSGRSELRTMGESASVSVRARYRPDDFLRILPS